MKAVLFDHDGTLVDSLSCVVEATNGALAAIGRPVLTRDQVVAEMGWPTTPRMGRHAGLDDPGQRAALAKDFYVRLHAVPHLARAYPGVLALLERLRAAGVPMAVVSNNAGTFCRGVCATLGLAPYLSHILGEEDIPAPKPDGSGLLRGAQCLGVDPAECWYVGDTEVDLRAARAAGMRVIGVTWGTMPRASLEPLGFDRLIDHPDSLSAPL